MLSWIKRAWRAYWRAVTTPLTDEEQADMQQW